jgi:predicted glycoside hydrolase/deacetylase ChbG (UPF0249 family)
VDGKRYLIVSADDFGIGPATSQGILDLAADGLVTAAVLLVNSPHAAQAVQAWKRAGRLPELGWHPCLTLDRPVLPGHRVPSLVRADGSFWPLARFVCRLYRGAIQWADIRAELQAQYERFVWMVGQAPTNVNTHHHVQVFPPVGRILLDILAQHTPAPYVRRVREPWSALASVPGARCKRLLLTVLGRLCSRRQEGLGYPGSDWLAGITDPPCVADTEFLARWLTRLPGAAVELTCHPGYLDTTLLGRDATPTNGQMQRRPNELRLLRQANFRAACRRANLTLIAPSQLIRLRSRGETHAA